VTRTGSGFDGSLTRTGPQGNAVNREGQGNWDADTKTWTRGTSAAGPQGRNAASSGSVTRTDSGFDGSQTRTGPQGNTVSREDQGSWDADTKTWTREYTTTGPEGETASGGWTRTPAY
jgi:hypothetical protein